MFLWASLAIQVKILRVACAMHAGNTAVLALRLSPSPQIGLVILQSFIALDAVHSAVTLSIMNLDYVPGSLRRAVI